MKPCHPVENSNVGIRNRIILCPMGGTSLFCRMEHAGNHKKGGDLSSPGIAPICSTFMGQWLWQNKIGYVKDDVKIIVKADSW